MMGMSTALLAMTLGSSAIASHEQRKSARSASDLQAQYELQARKRAAEQKPMEKDATLALQTDQGINLGAMGLLIDKEKALTTKPKSIGLGTVASTLGLGTGA